MNPFSRSAGNTQPSGAVPDRSNRRPGYGRSSEVPVTEVPVTEVPVTEVLVTAPSKTWFVRVTDVPAALPESTKVTFLDDALEGVKIINPLDPVRVNVAGRRSILSSEGPGVQVFVGAQVPGFSVHVMPVTPAPGVEHRLRHLTSADFLPIEGVENAMQAKVPWGSMTVVAEVVEIDPIDVPDPEIVAPHESSSSSNAGTVLVLGGVALLAWAAWTYWPRGVRANPSCCPSCAQGRPCSGRRRR